ncbi:MAG TPA: uroporphyrinogen decarboxylase family protein [Atribacteraceae bacterium]|nr:uroporphyrinogen decarboxylase family protein [Atribacteraceae bacterium]
MTAKERVQMAVSRQPYGGLPHQVEFTRRMRKIVETHFRLTDEELSIALGNHIRYIDTHQKATVDRERGMDFDLFGVGWDLVKSEGYLPVFHPLNDWKNASSFSFPDPGDPILYRDAEKITEQMRQEYFILGSQGWVLMERAWLLRGFENFMTDIAENRSALEILLDRITECQIEVTKNLIKLGVDGIYTGDDYGTQRGLLLSPALWRSLLKPRLAAIWKIAKQAGLPVFHHSCGNVFAILDDLLEIGLDVLLPVQPQAMDIRVLQEQFGSRLSFMGGLSTQETLPFGTPKQVREETGRLIDILGKHHGYIVSASHEIGSDCSIANLTAFLEEISHRNGSAIPVLSI